jgi:hypothetical protein
MYHIKSSSPCPIQGHIKFEKCPAYYGIGIYKDVLGRTWDIIGIVGDKYVQARLVNDNDYIYSTKPCFRSYSVNWFPYTYEPTISQMIERKKKYYEIKKKYLIKETTYGELIEMLKKPGEDLCILVNNKITKPDLSEILKNDPKKIVYLAEIVSYDEGYLVDSEQINF